MEGVVVVGSLNLEKRGAERGGEEMKERKEDKNRKVITSQKTTNKKFKKFENNYNNYPESPLRLERRKEGRTSSRARQHPFFLFLFFF